MPWISVTQVWNLSAPSLTVLWAIPLRYRQAKRAGLLATRSPATNWATTAPLRIWHTARLQQPTPNRSRPAQVGRSLPTVTRRALFFFFFLAWQQILEKTHWLQKSVQLISCSPPVLPARHVSCTSLVVSVSLASYSSAYGRVRVALPASSSRPCNEIFPDRVSHKYGQTH
jgi:hypothetical protein